MRLCYAKNEVGGWCREDCAEGAVGLQPVGPLREKIYFTGFLRKCYEEADVSPAEVEYLEAFAIVSKKKAYRVEARAEITFLRSPVLKSSSCNSFCPAHESVEKEFVEKELNLKRGHRNRNGV
ncbi:hypothetical protein EVAR_79833_1 [Eumeta japonica]|uniref:Uncharacterized protein n=1 Tax=Eumeta variegata TaxID=151549 RepID=A0A4C1WU11_EUMVA|nr:hypothetical protein EVAR_79833_1 [Eumeta japonica]